MKTGYQVVRKFTIGQKEERELITTIKTLLKSNSIISKCFLQDQIYYRIEVCSLLSNTILLQYLNKFPCLGQKQVNMLVYQRLNGYIIRKEHLIENKLVNIKKLCQQLKKHTSFFENQNI